MNKEWNEKKSRDPTRNINIGAERRRESKTEDEKSEQKTREQIRKH